MRSMCSTVLKQQLDQRVAGLSDESVRLIIELIDSLRLQEASAVSGKAPVKAEKVSPLILGALEGKLRYMADDFDETPECFKEYV